MLIEIGRWKIDCNPAETANCFSLLPVGNNCECNDCRNFQAALEFAFPQDFLHVATQLGLDTTKSVDLCHYGKEPSGLHYTGGWFHLIGSILSGRDALKETSPMSWVPELEQLPSGFEFGFTQQLAMVSSPFQGKSVLQLEFCTRVPWVINEPEPE